MALRSVLDIDVNTASFEEFQRLFQKYQDALDKMPGAWGKVNEETNKARSQYADIAASLLAMVELLRQTNRETDDLEEHAGGAGRFFSGMARDARDLAHHVTNATRDLLRWTGIAMAVTGLAGFGSVWGLEEIGAWSGNLRRSATGLGFAPGNAAGLQSFRTDLSRLVDPGQFLGGVNQALNDVNQRWTLYAAGLNEGQLRGDTGQVGLSLLQNAWRTIQGAPEGQLAQIMQARGLDRFLSLQDAVRLKHTPYNELEDYLGQTRRDLAGNKISDEDLRRWQTFNVALERAGNTLWNTIVKDLAPLADPLTHLSQGVTDVADAFLKSPMLKGWINDVAEGLEHFAKYVGTPQFEHDVKDFVQNVEDMAKAIANAVKWLASWLPASDPNSPPGTVTSSAGPIKIETAPPWTDLHYWFGSGAGSKAGGMTPSMYGAAHNFKVPAGADADVIRQTVAAAGGNLQTQAAFLAMFGPEDPGLSPSGTEHIPGSAGVGGYGGASWAQWTATRRRQLEAFGWTGTDLVKDREASAKMLYWELTTDPKFKSMVSDMNSAPGAVPAAVIGGRVFEQGGAPASMFGYRGGETQAGLDAFHSRGADAILQSFDGGVGSAWTSADTYRAFSHSLIPPWVRRNSTGQPYELNMTSAERANQDREYAYIKAHPTDWLNASGSGADTYRAFSHSLIPPWVRRNSTGQPYELNMTSAERANQDREYAYIKAHPTDWLNASGSGAVKLSPAMPGATIKIENNTGGNAGVSASAVATP